MRSVPKPLIGIAVTLLAIAGALTLVWLRVVELDFAVALVLVAIGAILAAQGVAARGTHTASFYFFWGGFIVILGASYMVFYCTGDILLVVIIDLVAMALLLLASYYMGKTG